MALKVGDTYRFSEDYEDSVDQRRQEGRSGEMSPVSIRRFRTKEKKVFVRNMVFLVRI